MTNEGIRDVLAEVQALAEQTAERRQSNRGNVLAALKACEIMNKYATPENAREMALATITELVASIAEADKMGADVVARVGR